ncbi:RhoGAP-domain-containing protein [Suhomyces tanzawaensis NRRL Y-17324]|uniref:RhoGAP-domain-containing protein n=1 Tax=Suhomyces tanzawaensis NRRL Y-17324 TaxID=984487 RepID=A0A1E4SPI5_9ASCO|nr:RhoGAP-domain-containing protein [Suhomyces tanzawaensis NRRL Y-17324]ODV81302.1 RhoGAP-domain-containing protein [Suhomyces tanzawaensis NRRL Y-17324]
MSHSLSPTNRNSIFGWVKNLKRGNFLSNESVNEITSDNDLLSTESRSPVKTHQPSIPIAAPNKALPFPPQPSSSPPAHQQAPEFLRPLLNHKSRSSNNVNRVRSNSLSQSEKSASIRQHRDSFLQHHLLVDENSKYFGVPLADAINEASAKISILNPNPSDPGVTYGEIPIVVAKCGVYLKNNGLNVEGIFRVGGSSKRLKELQVIFNSPPDYGKKLSWEGYTVHDAASILRRFLNALPEPLIPLELYEAFRDPLRSRSRIINYMKYKAENPNKSLRPTSSNNNTPAPESANLLDSSESQPLTEANIGRLNNHGSSNPSSSYNQVGYSPVHSHSQSDLSHIKSQQQFESAADEAAAAESAAKKSAKKSKNYRKLTRDVHEVIDEYKLLVDELPTLSKQLLFYILDLLSMVQNNADENLMSSRNLAAIFQPSILSHPNHDMDPVEYALSQLVVEFLIQYAYKLLPKQTGSMHPSPSKSLVKTPERADLQLDVNDVIGEGEVELKTKPTVTTNFGADAANQSSNVTSTSTTPIESEPSNLLSKPPQPPFKRQYSKSLPISTNQDMVGLHDTSKSLGLSDYDNDYEITDDDNEIDMSDLDELHPGNLHLNSNDTNEPAETAPAAAANPKVAIIVSTPSTTSVPQASLAAPSEQR